MPLTRPSHTIEALYNVGRNVVNFQRLEQILKLLAQGAPLSAPLSTLPSVLETRKAKSERLTFGGAVKKWIETTCPTTKPQQGPPPDDQIIVSFGFELPWSQEYSDQLSVELESLAQERNSLIHLDFAQLNFEDESECTELSIRLNAQNERIKSASDVLEAVLRQREDLRQWFASNEDEIREIFFSEFGPRV